MTALPIQDASTVEGLAALESVAALSGASHLKLLVAAPAAHPVRISAPRIPEYGQAMFDFRESASAISKQRAPSVIWSGAIPFRQVELTPSRADKRLKRLLISDSRDRLASLLKSTSVPGKQPAPALTGPVNIRDYGRTSIAPHLAFVDVTWRIKHPRGTPQRVIDSTGPFVRVEYVFNTSAGKPVFAATSRGSSPPRAMRLFKEPRGPLLMAASIECDDGSSPVVLDLDTETFSSPLATGTGGNDGAAAAAAGYNCFPAQ